MKILRRITKSIGLIILTLILLLSIAFICFNLPVKTPDKDYDLGITFSYQYAKDLGLDWKETYLAILDDLKVKKIRIPVYWSLTEKEKDKYDFNKIDWQLKKAAEHNVEVILVVGQRVPRWPECFIPEWIDSDEEKKEQLLEFIETVVTRYKDNSEIKIWQVENEPFLPFFGICPEFDLELFEKEIALVKKLDNSRPILLTDSGELSFWYQAAKRADIFGTTMYRTVYKEPVGYYTYPVGPNFFKAKSWFISRFTNQRNLIVIELQAEPWASGWVVDVPLEEQLEVMNEKKLVEFIDYARKGDFDEIYLWGAEWWYWLKTEKDHDGVWNKAEEMFNQ